MKSLLPSSRFVVSSSLIVVAMLSACGSNATTSDPAGSSAAVVSSADVPVPVSGPETDAEPDGSIVDDPMTEAGDACALFALDEVAAAADKPVTITEGNDDLGQCDYQDDDGLPAATVLVQPDDGEQLQIGRIVLDSLATSVDEISVVGFAGVHGHDLDAGFAMYDTATVSTGAIIVSVSLYGGEASTRSASVLALLELGVPRL